MFSLPTSASERGGPRAEVRALRQAAEALPALRRRLPTVTGLGISKLGGRISRGLLWKGPRSWHRSSAFQKFCCEHNRDLYEFIVNERKTREGAGSVPIAAGPRESHGTEAERPLSKQRAYQRYRAKATGRTGDRGCLRTTGNSAGKSSVKKMKLQQEGMKEEKNLLWAAQVHIPPGPSCFSLSRLYSKAARCVLLRKALILLPTDVVSRGRAKSLTAAVGGIMAGSSFYLGC